MKLAQAIEGGLTGASTLSLLQAALHKIDHKAPRPLFHQSGLIKKLKKHSGKKGKQDNKLYMQLAAELLANAAYFGLAGLGKKKNAILRGGLLGAAAGLGSAFMRDEHEMPDPDTLDGSPVIQATSNSTKQKLITIGLYTAGGLLAGVAVKKLNTKKKKSKK
jgi:hypothetical protein